MNVLFQLPLTLLDDRCATCLLRGGLVLKPRSSNMFNHAICSVSLAYQPLSRSQFSPATVSCYYCWSFSPINYRRISSQSFLSCYHPKCSNSFHLTCGLVIGCTVQLIPQSSSIRAFCHLHVKQKKNQFAHALTAADSTNTGCIEKECNNESENDNNFETNHEEDYDEEEEDDDGDGDEENDDDDDNDAKLVPPQKRISTGTQVILNDGSHGSVINNEVCFHYAVDFGNGSYSYDM